MGKKGSWFRSVKKAMGSESQDQKDQGTSKSKKNWFGKKKATDPIPRQTESGAETAAATTEEKPPPIASPPPAHENTNANEIEEMQKQQHTSSLAIATAKAAEAAMAAAQAAAELARLTNASRFPDESKEEGAAIRIQTAFRGYLARRALRVLRGRSRLKTLMLQGASVKRQTANALKCMQTLVRVQSEIHARRVRTSEENQARQRQLLEKHGKELAKLQKNLQQNGGDNWNTSLKSKEQIQARLQNKHEAAIRREKALSYSFNHQRTWRNSATTKPAQTLFVDSSINPHWGWSWLERWLAARPWENASPINPDLAPLRSSLHVMTPSGSQIAKALLYHVSEKNNQSQSATSSPRSSVRSTSSPRITTANQQKRRNSTGRLSTSSTPARRARANNEDAVSVQSAQSRRELDNESLASSPVDVVAVPSYMASTESARARSRMGSPDSTDRMSVCSGKRRVSYPSSPARSRKSASSITDA